MIILVGPSASGKTEIAKSLIKNFGFKKFVTTTTRLPRVGEINDVDYHFVTKDFFDDGIKNNRFIEFVNYNSNFYGTSKEEIDNKKVLILEPNGLKAFNALNNKDIISFYIDASHETRKKRMIARQDKLEDIQKRLKNDTEYFEIAKGDSDYIIDNDNDNVPLEKISKEIYDLYVKRISQN